MQRISYFLLLAFLVACSNSSDEKISTEDTTSQQSAPGSGSKVFINASPFARFLALADSSYSIEKFESTGQQALPGIVSDFSMASIQSYQGLLSYNKDSSLAVDLFSYGTIIEGKKVEGGEPDSEAALLDFSNMKRKRLLYFGPSYGFTDASFENGQVVIAGYERLNDEFWRPLFWVVNLQANTIETFDYSDTLKAPLKEFFKQRFPGYQFD